MAEQKITVRLDPRDVADLKQFVRDEVRREQEARQALFGPASPLASEAQMAKEQLEILRSVTRERDSLARRCAARFAETQALEAELEKLKAKIKAMAEEYRRVDRPLNSVDVGRMLEEWL